MDHLPCPRCGYVNRPRRAGPCETCSPDYPGTPEEERGTEEDLYFLLDAPIEEIDRELERMGIDVEEECRKLEATIDKIFKEETTFVQ